MVDILETGKHHLSHHDQDSRFTQNTPDTEWIETLARDAEKPIVVSGDGRILKRPYEVKALRESGLTYFILVDHWADLQIHEMAWKFLKVWPVILKEAAVSEPTVYTIACGSSLKVEKYGLTRTIRK
ncbi:MAG: hypothetical protein WCJ09_04390 [Planctomycetota bacterium]